MLEKFLETIESRGEYFLSCGNKKSDLGLIQSVIARQGYWSGNQYRFYFDSDMDLVSIEPRRFGA